MAVGLSVPARRGATPGRTGGLLALRPSGAVSELLFVYECAAREPGKLRPVAERLGLTVQAVSHLGRQLARRGLVETRGGHYRPTMAGIAWLHASLNSLGEDISERLNRLPVVRSTRAVAATDLVAGSPVSLELLEGVLTARRGPGGGSRGKVRHAVRAGDLVEVSDLEGIVAIPRGEITVYVVPRDAAKDGRAPREVATTIERVSHGLLAAQGLEAVHLVRESTREPVVRFGVSAACAEASRLGVRSLVFVSDEELPRFLAPYAGPDAPPVTVSRLARVAGEGR